MNSLIPTWRRLRRYGSSRLIQSSYFWVVSVPIVAKLIPQIEAMLSSFAGTTIELTLPFSWQMFYFGSIFFAISSWIYSIKCPHLIQRYKAPDDYWNTGHGLRELDLYAEETFEEIDKSKHGITFIDYASTNATNPVGVVSDSKADKNSKFFFIQENTQYKRTIWRMICVIGYVAGGVFFVIVLIQNFLYVLKQALNFQI